MNVFLIEARPEADQFMREDFLKILSCSRRKCKALDSKDREVINISAQHILPACLRVCSKSHVERLP